jgi:hypothetical protein
MSLWALDKNDWSRLPPGTDSNTMHQGLMDAYRSSLPHDVNHFACPLAAFIARVTESNHSTCQAVFDSGFLSVLTCMYSCNFSAHLRSIDDAQSRSSIIETVSTVLVTLCRQPNLQAEMLAHPIGVLWPKNEPLLSILGDRTAERKVIWKRLGPIIVARILSSLRILFQSPVTKISHMTELSDAQVDLKEFSRQVRFHHTLWDMQMIMPYE